MFLDKVKIKIQAGNGGNGKVSFHRENFFESAYNLTLIVPSKALKDFQPFELGMGTKPTIGWVLKMFFLLQKTI